MHISRRSLLLAGGAASLGLATGCGPQASTAELTSLTVMGPVLDAQAPDKAGALQVAIEKLIGKSLDITWVPNSNYGDRTNVTLASDKIPQIMVIQGKSPGFVQSAQAGAFWDLTDIVDSGKYPNLKASDPVIRKNSSINGKVYGIYRARDAMRAAVMVRKDWLGKLGLSMPKTTDDLYQLAKAFKEGNPSGAGNTGIIIPKWPGGYGSSSPYDVFEVWFGAPNGWGERDGKLVPGFDTEEFLEANRFSRKLVSEGLVNADFATLDSAKWNEPFFQGKGGIIVDVSSRGMVLANLFKEKNPDNYLDFVDMTGNLVGPSGTKHSFPTVGYAGFIAFSKQSVRTEDQLHTILTVMDKMATKEGQVLMNNGIEGVNFSVVDGKYAKTIKGGDADRVSADTKSFAQLGTNNAGYLAHTTAPNNKAEEEFQNKRLAFHAEDLTSAVPNAGNAYVSPTYVTKGAQLDQIIGDARLKFVAGQLDEAGLKAEIARWHSSGGDDIVKEMNELWKP